MQKKKRLQKEKKEYKGDVALSIHDHDDIQYIERYDSFNSDGIDYDASLNTALVSNSTVFAVTIGRKKGSTNNAKLEYKKRKNLLIDEISDTWYDLMRDDRNHHDQEV